VVIADGKGKIVNEKDEKLAIAAKKAFWFGANLGLLAVLAVSAWSCVDIIRKPLLRVRSDGPERTYEGVKGSVKSASIQLSDPSMLDRLVAAAPSLSVVVISMAVLIYISRDEWREIETDPGKLNPPKALPVALIGAVFMLTPIAFQILPAVYFQVQISFEWDPVSVLVAFLVVSHLFVRSGQNQERWIKEYRRAHDLDQQMKEVV